MAVPTAEVDDLRKRWPNVEETELLELKRKYAPNSDGPPLQRPAPRPCSVRNVAGRVGTDVLLRKTIRSLDV
jgi:hypothetical protein